MGDLHFSLDVKNEDPYLSVGIKNEPIREKRNERYIKKWGKLTDEPDGNNLWGFSLRTVMGLKSIGPAGYHECSLRVK